MLTIADESPISSIMENKTLEIIAPLVYKLQAYHRYEVVGIENIPQEGPALIVCTHSLATYDIALLAGKIYDIYGRICRSLADRLFFKIPYLGELVKATGGVEGSQQNAHDLLIEGNLVTVAPGGMRESLRPSDERYRIMWDSRKGFAKLSMMTGAPVVLAACPKADDLYSVYESPLTKWAYRNFKVPLMIARGWGLTPLPRPVKLYHFLSEPMQPPKPSENEEELKGQVEEFHAQLKKRMETLIGEAIAYSPKEK